MENIFKGQKGSFQKKEGLVEAVVAGVVEMHGKRLLEPRMPQWLVDLPAGQYTVKELMKISNTTQKNVSKVMNHYCTTVEYVPSNRPHLKKCVYNWS